MKAIRKQVAGVRVKELFALADDMFPQDRALAQRYVDLARKMSMRHKVRMPSELKRKFCKHCYAYLRPGSTSRVRLQKSKVVMFCFSCKKFTRIPYTPRRKKKVTGEGQQATVDGRRKMVDGKLRTKTSKKKVSR